MDALSRGVQIQGAGLRGRLNIAQWPRWSLPELFARWVTSRDYEGIRWTTQDVVVI